eukprot:320447-Chlamydomonas_euryale.AAC.7
MKQNTLAPQAVLKRKIPAALAGGSRRFPSSSARLPPRSRNSATLRPPLLTPVASTTAVTAAEGWPTCAGCSEPRTHTRQLCPLAARGAPPASPESHCRR